MQKGLINILTILLISWQLPAQTHSSTATIDSISYQQYLEGDWDGLIATGKLAKNYGIDFMYLQQRLGYAYFARGMYYQSKKHYSNALRYDPQNEITQLYLYYTNLLTGHTQAARRHAGKLSKANQLYIREKAIQLIKSLDAEYSYKQPETFFRENEIRNNAFYRRIGLLTHTGFRASVYNSLSGFQQTVDFYNTTNQLEYLGLINIQLGNALTIQGGIRHLGTRLIMQPDTFFLTGTGYIGNLHYQWKRMDLSISSHHFSTESLKVSQWGMHWGTGFSGAVPLYFKSSLYRLIETGTNLTTGENYVYPHTVFSQTAGFMFWKKKVWAEGSVTLGNQNYFSSNNGLYFHNALDPVTFKTGGLITAYLSNQLSMTIHYGYEKKYLAEYDEYYYQQGITGGIQWKF
jgi:tetratricopeptide (TPR) repeat protein